MWDQIIEDALIQDTKMKPSSETFNGVGARSISCTKSDREFIRSLLSFNLEQQAIRHALKIIRETGERYISSEEYQLVCGCFFPVSETQIAEKLEATKRFAMDMLLEKKDVLEQYHALKQEMGITEGIISIVWRIARSLLDEKEYDWSYQVLFFLLSIEPLLIEGWMAYGYVTQKMKSLHTSLHAYLTARAISGDSKPEIDLMIADCYVDLHSLEEAKMYVCRYKERCERSCDNAKEREALFLSVEEKIFRMTGQKMK